MIKYDIKANVKKIFSNIKSNKIEKYKIIGLSCKYFLVGYFIYNLKNYHYELYSRNFIFITFPSSFLSKVFNKYIY